MQVYLITNDVNDKAYVGACAMPLERRWTGHKSWARKGRGYSLHAAMRGIGIDKFHVVRVWSGYVSRGAMKQLEQFYIKSFQTMIPNGYNETPGGTTVIHAPCTEERKRKISLSLNGHIVSEKTKIKIRIARALQSHPRGWKHSDTTKQAMSKSRKGQRRSPATEFKKGQIPWNKYGSDS